MKIENLNEGNSFTRFVMKVKDPKSKFAIIGTNDKDTNESHYNELIDLVENLRLGRPEVGYKTVEGVYTYIENGTVTNELTLIIDNIGKSEAITLARKINQETYIVKDGNFFGLLDTAGNVVDEFSTNVRLVNDVAIETALTRFISKHNEGNSPFKFVANESYVKGGIIANPAIYNGTEEVVREKVFEGIAR